MPDAREPVDDAGECADLILREIDVAVGRGKMREDALEPDAGERRSSGRSFRRRSPARSRRVPCRCRSRRGACRRSPGGTAISDAFSTNSNEEAVTARSFSRTPSSSWGRTGLRMSIGSLMPALRSSRPSSRVATPSMSTPHSSASREMRTAPCPYASAFTTRSMPHARRNDAPRRARCCISPRRDRSPPMPESGSCHAPSYASSARASSPR